MFGEEWAGTRPEIIRLGLSDLNRCYSLDQACFSQPLAFPKNFFLYLLVAPDCISFGIKKGRRLQGFITLQVKNREQAQLITLDIALDQRRRGIGKKLLEFAHSYLRERGLKEVFLETAVNNKPALSLYKKSGYQPLRTLKKYYPDGADAVRMGKKLSAE